VTCVLVLAAIAASAGTARAQAADAGAGISRCGSGQARPPRSPPAAPAKPAAPNNGDAGAGDGGAVRPASADGGAEPATTPGAPAGGVDADGGSPQAPGSPGNAGRRPDHQHPRQRGREGRGPADQPQSTSAATGAWPKDDIVSYLREKPNNGFQGRQPREATSRALWDSGFFDDIEVDMTREDRGVILRFLAASGRTSKSIEFDGNSELENDKLLGGHRGEGEHHPERAGRPAAACRRSRMLTPRRATSSPTSTARSRPQRDNEVIVKFKITEHSPVTVRRITFVGNYSVPDDDLRAVMQDRPGLDLLVSAPAAPIARTSSRRDVLLLNRLYYDKGYMKRAGRDPARHAHARLRRASRSRSSSTRARASRSGSSKIYEARTSTGKEIEPLGGPPPRLRQLVSRQERRLLKPRRAREGPPVGPHALPRRRLRQHGGRSPRPSSTP